MGGMTGDDATGVVAADGLHPPAITPAKAKTIEIQNCFNN